MHQSHGVGYEVYCRKHKVREKIENRRQQEYNESRKITANLIGKDYLILGIFYQYKTSAMLYWFFLYV